jgi:Ca2+-binding RTX toxin-like protein
LIAASTATLALLLGYAPTAWAGAGDDAHVIAVPVPNVANAAVGQANFKCPAGERAVGGGIGFVPSGGTGAVSVGETSPAAAVGVAASGWASAITNGSGAPQSFTAFAVCSASSDAVARRTLFTTALEGGSLAPCEAGERAIGGGITGPSPIGSGIVQLSGPVDESGQAVSTDDGDIPRSWHVSGRQHTGAAKTFGAWVVCSATSQATVQATAFTVAKGESGQESAICPVGQRALSGGLGTTGGRLGLMGFSVPTDENGNPAGDGTVARGWKVDVYNANPGLSETYKVFVVCEGPTPAPPPGPAPGPAPAPGPVPAPGEVPGPTPTCGGLPATIVGTDAAETLTGTPGPDVIAALGGNDRIDAKAGDDVVCGGAGADNLKGQAGSDRLLGQAGADRLAGGGGAGDLCNGGPGKDSAAGTCEQRKRI